MTTKPLGQLEAMGDEISFIQRVRAEQFENVDFTFFAADQEGTRRSWKDARDAGSAIIDLSAALEDQPGATVRSLWIERERGQLPPPELQPGPCVTAHPVAVMLALLLLRLKKAGADSARRRHYFRARVRARTARDGRTAPADRQLALVSAVAERCFRCASRVQHGGALWSEIPPCARFGGSAHSSALPKNYCEPRFRNHRFCCCRRPFSTVTPSRSSSRWKRRLMWPHSRRRWRAIT